MCQLCRQRGVNRQVFCPTCHGYFCVNSCKDPEILAIATGKSKLVLNENEKSPDESETEETLEMMQSEQKYEPEYLYALNSCYLRAHTSGITSYYTDIMKNTDDSKLPMNFVDGAHTISCLGKGFKARNRITPEESLEKKTIKRKRSVELAAAVGKSDGNKKLSYEGTRTAKESDIQHTGRIKMDNGGKKAAVPGIG